mmetsp:Transcript_38058/g.96488  ORF Transcript_38058/g.96488 Transcript_38058/m.96488 type:complete len:96 (-) Transcript_38058:279-566(-)
MAPTPEMNKSKLDPPKRASTAQSVTTAVLIEREPAHRVTHLMEDLLRLVSMISYVGKAIRKTSVREPSAKAHETQTRSIDDEGKFSVTIGSKTSP